VKNGYIFPLIRNNARAGEIFSFFDFAPHSLGSGTPPKPPVVLVEVCRESQLLPNEWCPEREVKTFIKGQEPTSSCTIHKAPEKSCYEKYIADRPFWKWQIGAFIRCLR